MSIKNKILKNTFYYTLIPIIKYGLVFLTLPIMTRFLTPSDYGKVALVVMVTQSLSSFLLFGMIEASVRFFFKYKSDAEKLNSMYSTYFIFISGVFFLGFLLIILGFPFLLKTIFKTDMIILWVFLSFIQFMLLSLNLMNQYYYQNSHLGRTWAINEFSAIIIQVPITLSLVISKIFTYEAVIIGGLAGEIVKFLVIFSRRDIKYKIKFSTVILKESFKYAWPTIPVMLLDIGYKTFDKTLLSLKKGIGQVGILDMSNKITLILKTLMDGLGGSTAPVIMDFLTVGSDESKRKIGVLFSKISALWIFLSLIIILYSQELIYLLTTKDYYLAIYVVPIYIYYHVFGVLGMLAYWLIRYPGKTYWAIPINALFLILNVILNLLLIPKYGVIGAAIATAIAAIIMQIIQFIIGMRITPIPIDIKKLITLFMVLFLSTGLLYGLFALNLNIVLNILIKLGIIVIYLMIVIILKIVTISELTGYFNSFINKLKTKYK